MRAEATLATQPHVSMRGGGMGAAGNSMGTSSQGQQQRGAMAGSGGGPVAPPAANPKSASGGTHPHGSINSSINTIGGSAAAPATTDHGGGGVHGDAGGGSTTSGSSTGGPPTTEQTISYSAERIIGHGSFGVVFQASVVETGEIVAIKKVLQDKRFKNRELQIMRLLSRDPHTNIVGLKHCFYSQGEKPDELYLNLVLEYVPETVYSISRAHQKAKVALPLLYVKLYMYQLCRALAHIHALGICHRDIKPQNLLVDPRNQQLKLCDFGSAKALVRGEPNVSYICSRYYRAPELIFGSTDYTTAIDVWSQGCVGAELLIGQPLFPGDSGVDQLVEIIKVLGTPTRDEISAMNSNYTEFKFPQIKACQWRKIFRSKTPDHAMEFIAAMLAYAPERRVKPLEGCAHPFFDELRDAGTRLPPPASPGSGSSSSSTAAIGTGASASSSVSPAAHALVSASAAQNSDRSRGGGNSETNAGVPLPPLFDFTSHELDSPPELLDRLIPPHARKAEGEGQVDRGCQRRSVLGDGAKKVAAAAAPSSSEAGGKGGGAVDAASSSRKDAAPGGGGKDPNARGSSAAGNSGR